MSLKSTNLYFVIAAVSITLITPATLFAQEWSAAQKEVWKNVETYWELSSNNDMDGFISYFHEDFSGWTNSSVLPDSRDQRAQFIKHFFSDLFHIILSGKSLQLIYQFCQLPLYHPIGMFFTRECAFFNVFDVTLEGFGDLAGYVAIPFNELRSEGLEVTD